MTTNNKRNNNKNILYRILLLSIALMLTLSTIVLGLGSTSSAKASGYARDLYFHGINLTYLGITELTAFSLEIPITQLDQATRHRYRGGVGWYRAGGIFNIWQINRPEGNSPFRFENKLMRRNSNPHERELDVQLRIDFPHIIINGQHAFVQTNTRIRLAQFRRWFSSFVHYDYAREFWQC